MTASTMTQFDLRAAVLEAASVDGGVTIAEVADKVLANMTADEKHQVVEIAVREMAARIISGSRRDSMRAPQSAKQSAIRAQWDRMLATRLHIGDGIWKLIGDCTAPDLDAAAGARYKLSTELKQSADRLQDIADKLRDDGAVHVRELPAGSVDFGGVK